MKGNGTKEKSMADQSAGLPTPEGSKKISEKKKVIIEKAVRWAAKELAGRSVENPLSGKSSKMIESYEMPEQIGMIIEYVKDAKFRAWVEKTVKKEPGLEDELPYKVIARYVKETLEKDPTDKNALNYVEIFKRSKPKVRAAMLRILGK